MRRRGPESSICVEHLEKKLKNHIDQDQGPRHPSDDGPVVGRDNQNRAGWLDRMRPETGGKGFSFILSNHGF